MANWRVLQISSSVYDFEDRLIRRTRSDGVIIDLTYDTNGNRIAKTVNRPSQPMESTTYLIDAAAGGWPQCVEERTTINGVTTRTNYHYGPSGPISQQTDTQPEQDYLIDAHGSIRALVSPTGQVTAAADYDAYGTPLTAGGTTTSNLGYNGEYYDTDLGLIYLRARFYNPSTGRFLNRDPYQGALEDPMSLNSYQFAGADPVDQIDPSGNLFLPELLAAVSIRVDATLRQLSKYEKVTDEAVTVVGSLYVALNYWTSVESVYINAINGTVTRSPAAWSLQSLSLFRASKYNWDLLREFKKNTSKNNPVETAQRVTSIAATIARSVNQYQKLGTDRGDASFGDVNLKRNQLPEFTPSVNYGALTFITGTRGVIREGLTGRHTTDVRRAVVNTRLTKLSGGAWHHHEVMGIMQYVPTNEHDLPHAGGKFFWSIMTGKAYKK
jgi:RHS repeat-associated protein